MSIHMSIHISIHMYIDMSTHVLAHMPTHMFIHVLLHMYTVHIHLYNMLIHMFTDLKRGRQRSQWVLILGGAVWHGGSGSHLPCTSAATAGQAVFFLYSIHTNGQTHSESPFSRGHARGVVTKAAVVWSRYTAVYQRPQKAVREFCAKGRRPFSESGETPHVP